MIRQAGSGARIFLSCGEASADRYGAALITALRKLDPTLAFSALGGPRVAAAGARLIQPADRIAVMGLAEVLPALPAILRARRAVWRHLRQDGVDLCLPFDFPGFNLRLARTAHRLGIPVCYLIPPQLWAWGRWRLGALRRHTDLLGTILPFEESFYRERGLRVVGLGHPLLDDYAALPFQQHCEAREGAFRDPSTHLKVGLLPGSRPQEVHRLMPVLKVAADLFRSWLAPRPVSIVVSAAPGIQTDDLLPLVAIGAEVSAAPLPELLPNLHLALVCSGTASLEAALAGVPHELLYAVNPLTYFLARRLVKVQRVGLANLILGRDLVREHLQSGAEPLPLAKALLGWVNIASARATFYHDAERVRSLCGEPGVWPRAARIILDFLAEGGSVG